MASRCRSLSKPTFSLLKSAITTKPTTTSASLLLTSRSSHNLSRIVSRLGCVQSLLPLHSAVSAARLTWWPGIDVMSSRSLSQAAAADVPCLTRFSLQAPKCIEVEFANGSVFELSAEFLRVHSPAADGKMRSVGGEKVIFGRRHVGIMKVEPIGNYGVRIIFDDLHKTGIYTWEYFYNLGSNKFTLMRNYINTLKKHGLSRDPLRRK